MPEKTLHEIAQETRDATAALRRLLDHQRDAARRRVIWITLLYVPFAMILSGLVTVSTVSICFLNGPSVNAPGFCHIMPGFEETETYNKQILKEFRQIQKRSIVNDRRLDRLERKING